jgi:hypothetical protein
MRGGTRHGTESIHRVRTGTAAKLETDFKALISGIAGPVETRRTKSWKSTH